MSDRIHGFTVVLKEDLREDDFEGIRNAVLMIKGVTDVIPSVSDISFYSAFSRVRSELGKMLFDFLYNEKLCDKIKIKEWE